ncbi:TetR/AcrR family transcriptional regulator [Allonocardiopsis opalescens]|uniref:TetR family transcriptional regulator n=1 Tax=Allonocardiopsis opalescens TaxID=1144618 RepID=A0A2T0QDE0_9ACTN|nr:TetR/AcrR family transcriptional regulator [Allonocardiopsis opalescens]PRY01918.1 TetR family transcriptional regulator [Allonocardiopsis opalescens]
MQSPGPVSERGVATRNALLAAARAVFGEVGFAQASVHDIVTRARASVGSLYHHFSGKGDLYLSLYNDFQQRQQERTRTAIHAARAQGRTEPVPLLIEGARAYLDGCILERELSRLFVSGDGPPGFDAILRRHMHDWVNRSARVFRQAEEPVDAALLIVVSGTMIAAVAELARLEDERRARALAADVLGTLAGIRTSRAG